MSTYTDTQRTGGWHTVNVGHLVMGLAFLGLAAVWAAVQLGVVPDDDVRWLLPLPWVFAGAAGLIASVVASGQRWRRSKQPVASYAAPAVQTAVEIVGETPDYTSDLDEKLAQHDPHTETTEKIETTKTEDDQP